MLNSMRKMKTNMRMPRTAIIILFLLVVGVQTSSAYNFQPIPNDYNTSIFPITGSIYHAMQLDNGNFMYAIGRGSSSSAGVAEVNPTTNSVIFSFNNASWSPAGDGPEMIYKFSNGNYLICDTDAGNFCYEMRPDTSIVWTINVGNGWLARPATINGIDSVIMWAGQSGQHNIKIIRRDNQSTIWFDVTNFSSIDDIDYRVLANGNQDLIISNWVDHRLWRANFTSHNIEWNFTVSGLTAGPYEVNWLDDNNIMYAGGSSKIVSAINMTTNQTTWSSINYPAAVIGAKLHNGMAIIGNNTGIISQYPSPQLLGTGLTVDPDNSAIVLQRNITNYTSYFPFDASSGIIAKDANLSNFATPITLTNMNSGLDNSSGGVLTGWTANGYNGNALAFNYSKSTFGRWPIRITSLQNISIVARINITNSSVASGPRIIDSNNMYVRLAGTNQINIFFNGLNVTTLTSLGSITPGIWTCVAATYSNTSNLKKIYINGTLDNSGAANGTISAQTQDIWVGAATPGTSAFFNGSMDGLSVYPYELTAAQVSTVCNFPYVQTGNLTAYKQNAVFGNVVNLTEIITLNTQVQNNSIDIYSAPNGTAISLLQANATPATNYSLPAAGTLQDYIIALNGNGTHSPFLQNIISNEIPIPYLNNTVIINPDGSAVVNALNATPSVVHLTVTPSSDNVTVVVSTWNTTGDFHKTWTEFSSNHSVITQHTIGDLPPNTKIFLNTNDGLTDELISDSNGFVSFTYTGGFSTVSFDLNTFISTANLKETFYSGAEIIYSLVLLLIIAWLGFIAVSFIYAMKDGRMPDFSIIITVSVAIGLIVAILLITVNISNTAANLTHITEILTATR